MDVNSQFWESILNSGCQFSIMVANSKFWVSILNSPSECLLFHSRLAGNRGSNWNSSSARNLSYFSREIENIFIEKIGFFCIFDKVHPQQKRRRGEQVDKIIFFLYTYSEKCMNMPGRITGVHYLKTDDNLVDMSSPAWR